jgi:hypothetical protein
MFCTTPHRDKHWTSGSELSQRGASPRTFRLMPHPDQLAMWTTSSFTRSAYPRLAGPSSRWAMDQDIDQGTS